MKPPCDEVVIESVAATAPCKEAAEPWILADAILGSSMAFVDSTVVNVALPALKTASAAPSPTCSGLSKPTASS